SGSESLRKLSAKGSTSTSTAKKATSFQGRNAFGKKTRGRKLAHVQNLSCTMARPPGLHSPFRRCCSGTPLLLRYHLFSNWLIRQRWQHCRHCHRLRPIGCSNYCQFPLARKPCACVSWQVY